MLKNKKNISIIIILFIVSRLIAIKAGVFTHNLDWLTQTFDITLMYEGLLKNVFYDFYQAPFLNLSIGLFVKFFGSNWQTAISIFYTILSLGLIIQVYFILIKLNVNKKLAFYTTIFLLVVNPTLIYYERYVVYHTPVAFLLVNSVLFFIYFIEQKKTYQLLIVYFSLAFLVCYRTSFTLFWFIAIAIIIILLTQSYKKQLFAITFPLLLILAVYTKNLIVFGSFASSNMIGNNLASFTSFVSSKIKNEAIVNHKLSKFYEVGIWANNLNDYKLYLKDTIIPNKFKNIGVLTYPTSGVQISHHHYFKHEILAALYNDGKYLIIQEPISILKGLVWGIYVYFMPQGDYVGNIENVKKIYLWNRIYNIYVNGQIDPKRREELNYQVPSFNSPNGEILFSELFESMDLGKVGWFIVFSYIIILIYVLKVLYQIVKDKFLLRDRTKIIVFIFILFIYPCLLYLVLGSYENNRLRFELIGIEILLFVISINKMLKMKFKLN